MKLISIEKFYYGFISSISILIFAMVLWSFIKDLLNYFLISAEEYRAIHDRRFQECKKFFSKDERDYEKCVEDVKKDILLERKYNLKKSIIEFFWYSIALMIVFIYHYRKFRNLKDER